MRTQVILLALAMASTACQPPAQETARSTEVDVASIKRISDEFDAGVAARDADALAAMYTDDAVRMMPDLPAWVGNEAIRAGFAQVLEQEGGLWASIEVDNVTDDGIVSGDWATARGSFTASLTPAAGGEPIADKGKWMALLKRQADGTWKTVWDIWNRDQRLPQPRSGT